VDPFSHLLLGYLLGFGIWGSAGLPYVVAAAIGGALPDADVALYPLSHRFPLLRHRGVSHSILGVTVIAAIGCLFVPRAMAWGLGSAYSDGSTLVFFVALEVGGLSHVFLRAPLAGRERSSASWSTSRPRSLGAGFFSAGPCRPDSEAGYRGGATRATRSVLGPSSN
jgi:membrane-bound metal-dependent hydrolase YbcI (DUF457 family)